MNRKLIAMLLCAVCILLFTGCNTAKYNEDDFLGKTSAEIIDQYGSFDCIGKPADTDGLYRNCRCGYTIKEPRKGFLGTSPEVLFFISFNADGVAVQCSTGNRPGG
ncbi:MAG: hypothetical protein IJY28_03170 [Clostridia bacterium]|nr:hypothetical protein [Clostridia bacterium]